MVRQQRISKVHEDRYKDELVKRDMLDPPRYLRRTQDIRGKALSFGVLDWQQLDKCKDNIAEESKGACCSYASSYSGSVETSASSLELDLATGVIKKLELDLKPQAANVRKDSFSLRSQEYSDVMEADTVMRMEEKGKLDHQLRKQQEHLVENEQRYVSDLSKCISPSCLPQTNPGSETSEVFRTVECQEMRHDVEGECSSPVKVVERNQISGEKLHLSDQNIPIVTSKRERHASPNRRFSFSFSQMSRSFSSKESSSSVPTLSRSSHGSAKSGPLTFNNSTRTKPNGHSRTRSGSLLMAASKPSNPRPPPTMEKNQSSSRVQALLQFTLRKGISLFQFVVNNNRNNVLAATMKSSDSSTSSYTLYSVKEVKNKGNIWLSRHRNEEKNHPFVHTIIGKMKTVTSLTSDLATHKSESVLFGVETNEELAAIVQTRNKSQKRITTTIILPSGFHTLPKDSNAPLPLIDRWKSGGTCDCGGWDIGCKLRVFSNIHTKSQSFSNFQLYDQERKNPAFKMVTHDDELHSVEFSSSISLLEAFFISLAVSSHQNLSAEEDETFLIGDGPLRREKSTKYASNPPVSPIGRV